MKKLVIGSIVILTLAAVPVMAFAVPAQAHHGYDHANHNHGYCQGILPDINQGTQSALTTYATAAANATAQIEAKQAAEAAAAEAAAAAAAEAASKEAAAQKATARQAAPQNAAPQSNTYSARHYFVDNNGDGICDNYGSANCGHSGGGTNGGGRHHSEGRGHH